MKKGVAGLISFCLVLALGACGSVEQYELDGTWNYTTEVTESNIEGFDVGDTGAGTYTITATETAVTLTDEGEPDDEGTIVTERSGNKISYSDTVEVGPDSIRSDFEGTFTSPTAFSGTISVAQTIDGNTTSATLALTMTKQ